MINENVVAQSTDEMFELLDKLYERGFIAACAFMIPGAQPTIVGGARPDRHTAAMLANFTAQVAAAAAEDAKDLEPFLAGLAEAARDALKASGKGQGVSSPSRH